MLSALTSNMAPFFAATEDMRTAITGPPKTTIENVSKYEFIGSCLQQYPLEAMRRIAREKILDTCLLLDVTGCSVARPLMYKLWKSGNAGSFMATNPQAIKTWFAVPGVANILRRLLGHAFINRDQEKTKEYLSGLLQMNYSVVKGAKKSEGLTAGDLEMTWVVITEFWKFRNDQGINNGNLEKMRKRFLEQLIKSLDTRKNLDAEVLKYWRDVWELERDDRAAASSLATKVAGKIASGWIKGEVNPDRVVESLGVVCSVAEDSNDVVNATAFAVVAVESLNGERESDILRHYTSMIERLDIATHREVTLRLVDSCFSEEVGDNIWKLFKILIKAIKSLSQINLPFQFLY